MPVAVEMSFPGGTLDQYDEVIRRLGYEREGQGDPAGLFHWAAQTPEGVKIVDVWESEEAFGRFAQERLGPVAAELGVAQPETTLYQVHNYLYGPRFAR